MRTALNTAQTSASKIGNTDLREALVAQDKPTSAMVASYQDILNVARQPDATRHQAKIRSIASRANAEAQAAGDAHDHVVSSLAQVMTPEQRKQYLAEVKQRAAESAARGKAAVTGG
jgi:cytochrome P450